MCNRFMNCHKSMLFAVAALIGIVIYGYFSIPPAYRTRSFLMASLKYYFQPPPLFKVIRTPSYHLIEYTEDRQLYHIALPYDRKRLSRFSGQKVYLITDQGEIDITMPAGYMYSLTASKLGGKGYRVSNEDGDTLYSADELLP